MTAMHECQFHPLPTHLDVSLNLTDSDMVVSSNSYTEYIGTHVISMSSGKSFHVTLTGDGTEELYQFCDQDFLEHISALLSFFQQEKDDSMSPDQEVLTYLFDILCVIMLVILGLWCRAKHARGHWWWLCMCSLCHIDMILELIHEGSHFQIHAYCCRWQWSKFWERYLVLNRTLMHMFLQVAHQKFSYPLLACDGMNKMNQINIGWTDPVHSHDFYDMSNDVIFLLNGKPLSHPVLSTIRYWKPSSSFPSSHVDTSNSKGGYDSVSS